MKLIIRKYGGSSLSTLSKIQKIAQNIKHLYDNGDRIIIVVSAMGKSTDELLSAAYQITKKPDKRELDMLLSIGERKSISLMALALDEIGIPTISLTGSQIGLITDDNHGNAKVLEIKGHRIEQELAKGKVIVVAGYQGVSQNKEITTLGRGGTDTTAISLAARFDADKCELMKDVDGFYSVPVEFIHKSYLRKVVNFEELDSYSDAGLQLISQEAMKIAVKYKVKLAIGNTYSNKIGTIVTDESNTIKGITQIIEKKCYISELKIEHLEASRIIVMHNKKLFIYFDLFNKEYQDNYMLLTLFGKSLTGEEVFNFSNDNIFIFSNVTDEKIEFLFTIDNYNIYKNEIFQKFKTYLN